jgi:hypothetical protein
MRKPDNEKNFMKLDVEGASRRDADRSERTR